jgi:hypothetical protein
MNHSRLFPLPRWERVRVKAMPEFWINRKEGRSWEAWSRNAERKCESINTKSNSTGIVIRKRNKRS